MRAFASSSIVVAVLASVAVAAPVKVPAPNRKAADPDTTAGQLHHMVAAIVLDKAGDLEGALSEYEKALKDDTPQPAIYWNMADIERRREQFTYALKDLEKYQALVKTDAERAEAQKFVDAIAATPYRLAIPGIDGVPAAVFVDGVHVGTGPMLRELADGKHAIDMITAERYIRRDVIAKKMDAEYTGIPRPNPPASELGNVVLSLSPEWGGSTSWRDENLNNVQFWLPGRMTLPPGHYETEIGGAGRSDRRACSRLIFDVPKDGIVYIYLQAAPREDSNACQNFKATTQKVVLP
ncbi:MAG TPA: hypothetical protein VGM90_22395 [Kofleriaceae bacterium]|jgi:tetratricopeptide (TPR) repeat protein